MIPYLLTSHVGFMCFAQRHCREASKIETSEGVMKKGKAPCSQHATHLACPACWLLRGGAGIGWPEKRVR